jgi:hypothetical protein
MEIKKYTEKSFVLVGEDTKTWKEEIKALGGRFNRFLKDSEGKPFAGWIFPIKKAKTIVAKLADMTGDDFDITVIGLEKDAE